MTPAEMIRLFRDGKKEYTESEVRLIIEGTFAATKEVCARIAESLVTKQSKRINGGNPFQAHMYWEDIAIALRALNVDCLDISPERVEKTAKPIHMRYAGSFSSNY